MLSSTINVLNFRAQGDGGAGPEACTVVAAFLADFFLSTRAAPSREAFDQRVLAGCAAWRLLTANPAQPSYLTAAEVVQGVYSASSAQPRWRIALECFGMHTQDAPPDAVSDAVGKLADDSDAKLRMEYLEGGLSDVMRKMDTLLTRDRPVVAALLTTSAPAHTICVCARTQGDYNEFFLADSLSGVLVSSEAPSRLSAYMQQALPQQKWAADDGQGLSAPGQFYLTVLEHAS